MAKEDEKVQPQNEIDIQARIKLIAGFDIVNQEIALQNLKQRTGVGLTALRTLLKKFGTNFSAYETAMKIIANKKIITSKESDKIYLYEDGIYVSAEKILLMDLQKMLKEECSEQRVKEIFGHIRRETYKSNENIAEENGNYICLKNGIYDVEKNTLEDFTSQRVFFNKIPVDFIEGVECPKFKEFLERACTFKDEFNEENYNTIQEYMGYCFERGYPFHKILVIYGDTDSSKTQQMIIMQSMLGEENYESIFPNQFNRDNYTSMLDKKMANIADEIPKAHIAVEKMKALSGETAQTSRELYCKPFKFVNEAKLIFAGNYLPKLKEEDFDDDAIYNRCVLITFKNVIPKETQIKNYGKIIFEEENSGILNFAIEGLKRLREQKTFSYSKTIEENKEIWLSETEEIYKFFLTCEKIRLKIGGICAKEDLYEVYCRWCEENNIQWLENNAFGRKVKNLYKGKIIDFQPKDKEGIKQQVHAWSGVEIVNYVDN